MFGNPVSLAEHIEQAAIEPARRAVIDVFGHSVVAQTGVTKTKREAPVVAVGGFMVKQQRQLFGMAQSLGFVVAGKVGKGPCHAGKAELA